MSRKNGLLGEISALPDGWIVMVETKPEKALETGVSAVKQLTDSGYSAIIVSVTRPYSNLLSLYKKNGIDEKKIYFIDCVSKGQMVKADGNPNVVYVDNASSLTKMAMAMTDLQSRVKGKLFVGIDSLTSLLIYNDSHVLARFIHTILTRLRIAGTCGLIITLEGETNTEVRAELAQLCDKLIKT